MDIRTILLENQDLELISKPSDGINGQEKLNNNYRGKKKNKSKQNEDVKGQICDFQNKRELLRDPH